MRLPSFLTRRDAEADAYERARARFRAQRMTKPAATPTPTVDVAALLGDAEGIPFGTLPNGAVARVAKNTAVRHALIAGASGSGKTRFLIGLVLQYIYAALGMPAPGFPRLADPGVMLELVDPKGELVPLLALYLGAIARDATDEQRETLGTLIRVIDLDADGITPMPLFDHATNQLPPAYRAELRVQVEDEGADHRATELSRHVRMQFYRVLAHLNYPLNYPFAVRFIADATYRTRVLDQVPDRDLRLYWNAADQLVPKATAASVLRFIQRRLGYPEIRLAIGLPGDDARRLLGNPAPPKIVLGNFAARTVPAARAMEQARLRVTDACAEAVLRDARVPGQLIADEIGMLFHRTSVLEDVFALASRTLRSAGLGLTLAGQDFETAVPSALVTTLKLNAVWTAVFRSDATEGGWVYPFVDPSDPALVGSTDAERRRAFLRHVQELPTRVFYLHVKGVPATRLTALPVPDPGCATGVQPDELREIFRTTVAKRSMVSRRDAEEAISAWEATVVTRIEVAPAATPTRVLTMDDVFRELDEEDDRAAQ